MNNQEYQRGYIQGYAYGPSWLQLRDNWRTTTHLHQSVEYQEGYEKGCQAYLESHTFFR